MIPDSAFFEACEIMQRNSLPIRINSSTHLGLLTQGKFFDNDPEIDFLLIDTELKKLDEKHTVQGAVSNKGLIYIQLQSHITLALARVTFVDNLAILNPAHDMFFIYPESYFRPWKEFWYKDKRVEIPNDYGAWYKEYYGEKWYLPNTSWHWMYAKNKILADSIEDAIVKYHDRPAY